MGICTYMKIAPMAHMSAMVTNCLVSHLLVF